MKMSAPFTVITFNLVAKHYLINALFPKAASHDYAEGAPSNPEAGVAWLLHADMSNPGALLRGPGGACLERLQVAGRLLNGTVTSIEKRRIHTRLAEAGIATAAIQPGCEPQTPVIVKTNLNAGGGPDAHIPLAWRVRLGLGMPPTSVVRNAERGYRVMSFREAQSLLTEETVVEFYVGNPRGLHARSYICGETVLVAFECSTDTIKHMGGGRERTTILFERGAVQDRYGSVEACEALAVRIAQSAQRVSQALGLDFGTIDFAISEAEEAFPIDVNVTPSWCPNDEFRFSDAASRGLKERALARLALGSA